jgi:hypothetical protein
MITNKLEHLRKDNARFKQENTILQLTDDVLSLKLGVSHLSLG